jgi:predicted GTPase
LVTRKCGSVQSLAQPHVVAGPEPGLTRDAVRVMWEWGGRAVELVDTAGWMRASKLEQYDDVGGAVAGMTVQEGQKALNRVHVVVLVLDALRCLNLSKVGAGHAAAAAAAGGWGAGCCATGIR